jgi:hypothetical protein
LGPSSNPSPSAILNRTRTRPRFRSSRSARTLHVSAISETTPKDRGRIRVSRKGAPFLGAAWTLFWIQNRRNRKFLQPLTTRDMPPVFMGRTTEIEFEADSESQTESQTSRSCETALHGHSQTNYVAVHEMATIFVVHRSFSHGRSAFFGIMH